MMLRTFINYIYFDKKNIKNKIENCMVILIPKGDLICFKIV